MNTKETTQFYCNEYYKMFKEKGLSETQAKGLADAMVRAACMLHEDENYAESTAHFLTKN